MNSKAALLSALCLCATTGIARADIIWDQSPAQVGGTIQNAPGTRYMNSATAQNFADRVMFNGSATLTGIDIYSRFQANFVQPTVGGSVTIRIHEGSPTGALQQFVDAISVIDTAGAGPDASVIRVHVDFDAPISLLAGTEYWIGMSGTGQSIGQLLLDGATGPLIDDAVAQYSALTFQGLQVGDMAFRLEGAVPEPATLVLFGIAFAGLGFSRRKGASSYV